jgi:starvation-inducible DNA-binding protein
MTVIATKSFLPVVDEARREEAGRALQATLVELIDLSLIGKQLHWNVFGPPFKPLHEQLDDLVDSWRDLSDTVAERSAAIGAPPDGRVGTIGTESELEPLDSGPLDSNAALLAIVTRLAEAVARMRGRMDRLGEFDLASQDVLVGVVRELEKQLWMLRSSRTKGGA